MFNWFKKAKLAIKYADAYLAYQKLDEEEIKKHGIHADFPLSKESDDLWEKLLEATEDYRDFVENNSSS